MELDMKDNDPYKKAQRDMLIGFVIGMIVLISCWAFVLTVKTF